MKLWGLVFISLVFNLAWGVTQAIQLRRRLRFYGLCFTWRCKQAVRFQQRRWFCRLYFMSRGRQDIPLHQCLPLYRLYFIKVFYCLHLDETRTAGYKFDWTDEDKKTTTRIEMVRVQSSRLIYKEKAATHLWSWLAIIGAKDAGTIIVGNKEGNTNLMISLKLSAYISLLESGSQRTFVVLQVRVKQNNVWKLQYKQDSNYTRTLVLWMAIFIKQFENNNITIEIICWCRGEHGGNADFIYKKSIIKTIQADTFWMNRDGKFLTFLSDTK